MSCTFNTNKEVIDKIKEMGFENKETSTKHVINCECGNEFLMNTCLTTCSKCNKLYGVTPCHSDDINSIVSL